MITIGSTPFTMFHVRDTNLLVDAIDPVAFALDERLPYWAELWPSSVALASWCAGGGVSAGRSVLELGCGLGLAGIAAARAGGEVTLSDYEKDALGFAGWNARVNAVPVTLVELDWRTPVGDRVFDIVLGADIMYDRANVDPLLGTLSRVMAPHGSAVLADPDRSTAHDFLREAISRGFSISSATTRVPRGTQEISVHCHTLRREDHRR